MIDGIAEKEVARARDRGLSRLDGMLETAETDEATGLPAWVLHSGVGPADGSSPFDT